MCCGCRGSRLQAADQLAAGVFANLGQEFFQLTGQSLHLFMRLEQLPQRVLQGEHGGVMAPAPDRTAEIAEVGQLREEAGVELFVKIARTLIGVRKQLPQRQAAGGVSASHGKLLGKSDRPGREAQAGSHNHLMYPIPKDSDSPF